MPGDKPGARFEIKLRGGSLTMPSAPVNIPCGASFFWPFEMNLNGAVLRYATAQPLCRIGSTMVFFAIDGIEPEFVFEPETLAPGDLSILKQLKPGLDCAFTIHSRHDTATRIVVLRQDQALRCFKADLWGAERLFVTSAEMVFDKQTAALDARRMEEFEFSVFPDPGMRLPGEKGPVFAHYTAPPPVTPITALRVSAVQPAGLARRARLDTGGMMPMPVDSDFDNAAVYHIDIPTGALKETSELYLKIRYTGDVARLYLNDRLVADNFYNGTSWEIGLKRFAGGAGLKRGLDLKILPLHKDYPVMIPRAARPEFDILGEALSLESVTLEPEYEVIIRP
jgi:hypothetical protein